MVWVLLCIALTNLGLGFYLGTMLLLPSPANNSVLATIATLKLEPAISVEANGCSDDDSSNKFSRDPHITATSAKPVAAITSSKCWDTACTNIRQDISTLYDRIRYSISANDKKLAKMIAAELQARIPLWQKLLEEKMAACLAALERNPAAKVDDVAPELCLAQTETLQTNLALLDWSDSTESILKKLEREIEAVKHLLPANC